MKKKEDKTGKKKEKRSPAGLEISKEGICKAENFSIKELRVPAAAGW